jgi:hypothetical protein
MLDAPQVPCQTVVSQVPQLNVCDSAIVPAMTQGQLVVQIDVWVSCGMEPPEGSSSSSESSIDPTGDSGISVPSSTNRDAR